MVCATGEVGVSKTQNTNGDFASVEKQVESTSMVVGKLLDRVHQLEQEVAQLKQVTPDDPGRKRYDEMSRSDKITVVQSALKEKASKNGGKAKMDYDEIGSLFQWNCARGLPHTLMKEAGHSPGFEHATFQDRNDCLRVDLQAVND